MTSLANDSQPPALRGSRHSVDGGANASRVNLKSVRLFAAPSVLCARTARVVISLRFLPSLFVSPYVDRLAGELCVCTRWLGVRGGLEKKGGGGSVLFL